MLTIALQGSANGTLSKDQTQVICVAVLHVTTKLQHVTVSKTKGEHF